MTPIPPRVETILKDLVAFDTQNPNGHELPLAEKLARDLTSLGARYVEVIPYAGHASTFALFGTETPRVIINAHIDTVPANSGYTTPPHTLTRIDRRLHGLGSADTKGAISAILEAFWRRRDNATLPPSIAVLFSGDEELGGHSIRHFLASDRRQGLERAIVCEPTGTRIGKRHRGLQAFRLQAMAQGGHSSLSGKVPNPMSCLARVAVALDDLGHSYQDLGPDSLKGICMNIASLEGGVAFNVIPTQASLTISIRPAPEVNRWDLIEEIRKTVTNTALPLAVTWENVATNPPFATHDLEGFRPLFGAHIDSPIDLPYGTEAGQFGEVGIDTVVFGPGHVEQAHAADEYVDLDELEAAVRIFGKVLG
jgi:acetylornithine deacetylase